MGVDFSIQLNKLGDIKKASEESIKQALRVIGGQAEKHAKDNCPVDTGNLRNSICFATIDSAGASLEVTGYDDEGNPVTQEVSVSNDEENSVVVGSAIQYAAIQEYGEFNHKTGGAHFLQKAMEENKSEYEQILKDALSEVK